MPRGLFLISWDSYAGGSLLFKYPDSLDVPDNTVQQLQISHNFVESIQFISTGIMSTLSIFNSEKQVIVALVLNENEESQDFYEILNGINRIITDAENLDSPSFFSELRTIYDLSHHVFKAREQVMLNLANQIAQLKEKQAEFKARIEYLIKIEPDSEKKVLLLFFNEERLTIDQIVESLNISKEKVLEIIKSLEDKELIEKVKSGTYEIIL